MYKIGSAITLKYDDIDYPGEIIEIDTETG
eukprot:SAG11_NODE_2030_length_3899_cov_6.833772_4_plen_30_part_00